MKTKLTLLVVLGVVVALGGGVIADNVRERAASTPSRTEADVPRQEVQMNAEPGTGERVPTVLPAQYDELKQQYRKQLESLEGQLNQAQTESEQQSIQEQMMALKQGYKVARLNLALEQARAEGKTEAEAQIMAALNNLTNPPVHTPQETPRNPVTGEALQGGAR